MTRTLSLALLCLLPALATADESDGGYGRWEVVTEMKMSGPDGENTFSSKTTECRSTESIDESSSEWTMNNCRAENRGSKGRSRSSLRCEGADGELTETVSETTADSRSFETVSTITTVSGGQKSVNVTTIKGRRIGDCPDE
jgi:hypothetical protein